MKIYISMDAEGISGIYKLEQVIPGGMDYDWARKMMANDINAAAQGAFNAGASEVFVNDAHNYGNNLLITDLDERIKLCSGSTRPLSMAQGVEKGYDAALLIGYHQRKGAKGVISHSFSYGTMMEIKICGKLISEFELIGHVCGHFGTPVIFVSGDDLTVKSAKESVSGLYSTVTKECIGNGSAACIHPNKTAEMIKNTVESAVRNFKADGIKPMTISGGDIYLEVRFTAESQADEAMNAMNTKRVNDSTVRFYGDTYLEAYKSFLTGSALAAKFRDDAVLYK